jgi:hypothetical protein
MIGVDDMPGYSVISITLSNEPIEHRFYKRNRSRPESLKLELLAPSTGAGGSAWHGMTSCCRLNGIPATI